MVGRRWSPSKESAAIVVMLLFVVASGARADDDVRHWRDERGQTHVTITGDATDVPPEAEDLPSASDDRFSVETSLRRRELERKLVESAARLERKREEILRAEESKYLVDALPTPADGEERERWNDLRRNALLAASSFEEQKRRRLFFLRRDERAVLRELRDLWSDVDRLRTEVRRYYGKLPNWWIDRVRCAACPSFEEIEKELAKNEVEIAGKTQPTPTVTPGPPPPTPLGD